MRESRRFVGALMCIAALWASPARSGQERLSLPSELAKYREWSQLLKSPYQVPLELWMRCMAPTPADWTRAEEKYGPHTKRYIRVYGNQVAAQSLLAAEKLSLAPGAIIAKEKFTESPHGRAEGVAFMVKRDRSLFPETGGWEFMYYPASNDKRRTHESCAGCHRAAASTDYVFGQYPR